MREGADEEIVAAFRDRDALRGKGVRVADGRDVVQGVADGIDGQGRLLVRTGAGVGALATGSVQVLG